MSARFDFYTEVVGFQLLRQTADTAELTVGGKYALHHFAILLPNRVALGLTLHNLLAHEIEIGQGDHDVSEALTRWCQVCS